MLISVALLLLTGLTWAIVGVLFGKAPSEKELRNSFFALNGILFTTFTALVRFPGPAPLQEVLQVAAFIVPSAIGELAAFFLLKLAMDRGSQGIAWSVAQSAMVIAFLGSVWILHTPASLWQWGGVLAILIGLVLFGKTKNKPGQSCNRTYYIYIFSSFALIGLGQFLRLVPNYLHVSEAALSWRLILQAPCAMIFWTTLCLSRKQFKVGKIWKFSLPYATVVTFGQVCFYLAADAAKTANLTAIVAPISVGSCIALFALYSNLILREPLKAIGWTATALVVAGIALLSIV